MPAAEVPNGRYGSLDDPAEMKCEPIRRLGGPHAVADRVELVAEITKR